MGREGVPPVKVFNMDANHWIDEIDLTACGEDPEKEANVFRESGLIEASAYPDTTRDLIWKYEKAETDKEAAEFFDELTELAFEYGYWVAW